MVSKPKNDERAERRQQKIDAGLLSERYPHISSIIITMDYYQKGAGAVSMKRTVNFFPGSNAYFLMECMRNDCINGGFDLEPVISRMVKGSAKSEGGELLCPGNNASGHTRINYKVAIQYDDTSR
jgi:hypothetical protein